MTPNQQTALIIIKQLIGRNGPFTDWLPSEAMAFCQVESAFRPHAYRYEPRLGEASYGIMQVLASTARSVDHNFIDPTQMYQPAVGIFMGMKVAELYWEQETKHFGREPTYEEWAASYNEGVGGAERDVSAERDPDPAYTAVWIAAQEHWASQGVDG